MSVAFDIMKIKFTIHIKYFFMSHFLFQPDPIDGVEFRPVRTDIHRGVVKIVDEEIHHDFEINNTECVVIGRDRNEVLASLQEGFLPAR